MVVGLPSDFHTFSCCSPPATPNVLTQPVPADLLPLNLLPRDWQLPPQAFESTFAQTAERLVQILLVLLLDARNLPYDLTRTCARADIQADVLVGEQAHIPIFVVVYVDLDCAGQAAGRGIVEVGRAPAAVPVVCGRVLVCDGYKGELRVILDREDAV